MKIVYLRKSSTYPLNRNIAYEYNSSISKFFQYYSTTISTICIGALFCKYDRHTQIDCAKKQPFLFAFIWSTFSAFDFAAAIYQLYTYRIEPLVWTLLLYGFTIFQTEFFLFIPFLSPLNLLVISKYIEGNIINWNRYQCERRSSISSKRLDPNDLDNRQLLFRGTKRNNYSNTKKRRKRKRRNKNWQKNDEVLNQQTAQVYF